MIGASFQIGRSALTAYQAAIAVVGQNIANVGNPNYARQSGRLSAMVGGPMLGNITPGGGVLLSHLQRHLDESIENQLRLATSGRGGAESIYTTLSRTESIYNELSDQDLSSLLTDFFGSFSALETSPSDVAARDNVVASADMLVRTIHRVRSDIMQQVNDLNDQVTANVQRVNEISGELASLNTQIVAQEATGNTIASALRDRREALLRELSGQIDIRVREYESGSVTVYAGSEPLVEFDRARELTLRPEVRNGVEVAAVRYADSGGSVLFSQGTLAGLLEARDVHLAGQFGRLDQLAQGLIYEVNRIHSSGVGLVGRGTVTSEYGVLDPEAALNSEAAGLPFPVVNGVMLVHVRDTSTGLEITRQIEVDLDGLNGDDTTLSGLAAQLDAVPGLNASVNSQNRLELAAGDGKEFWFTEDGSGALAALGVNSFFSGRSAADIDVASAVRSDSRLIAAGETFSDYDGLNAGRVALLAASTSVSALLGNRSISQFHEETINELAVETSAAANAYESADAVYNGLNAQREAVSGVSLDEEAINLTRYQQAYEGAARYIGVLDEMTDQLLALL